MEPYKSLADTQNDRIAALEARVRNLEAGFLRMVSIAEVQSKLIESLCQKTVCK
jgi:hypothetical protein